jgi:ATP-dependent Clp protease ATP-binding subunit ClpX
VSTEADKCSFCGRKKDEVNLLIAGVDGHICDFCIEQAHGIIQEEVKSKGSDFNIDKLIVKKPKEIKEFLDQYVIGQVKMILKLRNPILFWLVKPAPVKLF